MNVIISVVFFLPAFSLKTFLFVHDCYGCSFSLARGSGLLFFQYASFLRCIQFIHGINVCEAVLLGGRSQPCQQHRSQSRFARDYLELSKDLL